MQTNTNFYKSWTNVDYVSVHWIGCCRFADNTLTWLVYFFFNLVSYQLFYDTYKNHNGTESKLTFTNLTCTRQSVPTFRTSSTFFLKSSGDRLPAMTSMGTPFKPMKNVEGTTTTGSFTSVKEEKQNYLAKNG